MRIRGSFEPVARAWRSLRRTPGFFVIAVSSLAVALGLATTIIAQIDSLLHPITPIREPGRLFAVHAYGFSRPPADVEIARLRALPSVQSITPISHSYGLIDAGHFVGASGALMAPSDFFSVIGVAPRMGRVFSPHENSQSGVAIVTDAFWKRAFGKRDNIAGTTVSFGSLRYDIVGVLPSGAEYIVGADVILPRDSTAGGNDLYIVLSKPGVDSAAARRELRALGDQMRRDYGGPRRPIGFSVSPLKPDPLKLREYHPALMVAAAFVLIIAAANVSALMLARGLAKRRDHALRLALGAGRGHLVRDVVAEIWLITAVAGIAGVAIAVWAVAALRALTPVELSWMGFALPHFSARVFALLLGVIAFAVGIASIAPAWATTHVAPADPLKDSSATTTGRPAKRFQLLVVGELALSLILLLGAGLVAKSAGRVAGFDFGYEPRGLVQIAISAEVIDTLRTPEVRLTPPRQFDGQTIPSYRRFLVGPQHVEHMVDRIRAIPGVSNAAWISTSYRRSGIIYSDALFAADTVLYAPVILNVGPNFFETLGLPIVEGRQFLAGDKLGNGAAILDEKSSRFLFPNGNAVGGMIKLGRAKDPGPWVPVVGIARNAWHELPDEAELDQPFVVYTSAPLGGHWPRIVVRGSQKAPDVLPPSMRLVRDFLPPGAPLSGEAWIDEYREQVMARRFVAGLFLTLGIASLVLAAAGLFGTLSYVVNQRLREFAVRLALGAQRAHVLRLVADDALVMALAGTAIGGPLGLWAAFFVYEWLWGVYPVDAVALVTAEATLLAITLGAAMVPALRATRANPADVMRAM